MNGHVAPSVYLIVGVFAGGAWAGFSAANDDWAWTSGGGLIGQRRRREPRADTGALVMTT
jgi:hypothetical protein